MMNSRLYKHRIAVLILLMFGNVSFSQENYVESFNVADDVEVSINTSFTNIVFETWNKNKVEVEAFIEGEKLSEKEKQDLMKNWDLEITGNSKKVSITSHAGNKVFLSGNMNMPDINFMGEMVMPPMLHNFPVPPLPPALMENIGNIQFDYEAYEKDKEGYMKKFEAQMEKNFGKDFEEEMEAWGKRFEESWSDRRADSIGEAYGKKMEAWGETYGKNMEAWGEAYGKKMEAWAKELEQQHNNGDGNYSKTVTKTPNGTSVIIKKRQGSTLNSNAKKTLIIRLPKNAKTDINIRHGELKMADANNVRANLNYAPFTANSIDGVKTLISASYAPVIINIWKQGELQLKYVDKCSIEIAQNINLQANSSDVRIANISNQALLSGSFGDLKIDRISDGFKTLDIRLENTDAAVKIPAGAFSFHFTGNKSTLKYPKSLQLNESKAAGKVLVKGYNHNNASNKTITINSSYSNVTLQ